MNAAVLFASWLTRRGRRLSGLVAITAAVAVTAGPILGTAHLASVQHVACPVDGELIEIHRGTSAQRAEPTLAAQVVLRPDASQTRESNHQHEHCSYATHASPATATSSVAVASDVPAIPAGSVIPSRAPLGSRVDLYRIAPKSSPPTI